MDVVVNVDVDVDADADADADVGGECKVSLWEECVHAGDC